MRCARTETCRFVSVVMPPVRLVRAYRSEPTRDQPRLMPLDPLEQILGEDWRTPAVEIAEALAGTGPAPAPPTRHQRSDARVPSRGQLPSWSSSPAGTIAPRRLIPPAWQLRRHPRSGAGRRARRRTGTRSGPDPRGARKRACTRRRRTPRAARPAAPGPDRTPPACSNASTTVRSGAVPMKPSPIRPASSASANPVSGRPPVGTSPLREVANAGLNQSTER